MSEAPFRCDGCGDPAVVAVRPGSDEIRELFLLRRGEDVRCWCRKCWTAAFGIAHQYDGPEEMP